MQYRIQRNSDNIDWQVVCKVLREAGLAKFKNEDVMREKGFID